jgi:hypothetical protein
LSTRRKKSIRFRAYRQNELAISMITELVIRVVIAFTCHHHGKVLADLASGFALFWRPEEGLSPITAAEGLPTAVVDMPSGGSF